MKPRHDDMRERIERRVNEIIKNELGKKELDPQDMNTKWDWNATCRFEKQCQTKQRREFIDKVNQAISLARIPNSTKEDIIEHLEINIIKNVKCSDLQSCKEEKEK